MDLMVLKKKLDGFRAANGCIRNVPAELLLELRQTWENYKGSPEDFRAELGVKAGTLRNLLLESKKLNHVIASAGAVGLAVENGGLEQGSSDQGTARKPCDGVELHFDQATKVIRFSNVDLLIDFLRKSA